MIFHEMIDRHHWLSIETELIRLYPDEEQQIDAYRDVYFKLKLLAPETSDITIRLNHITDDDENYINVDGTDGRVDEYSGNDALALDFTPWEQWLGMRVDVQTLNEFTELEVIAHCLFEMTFIAFDQEEIQEQMDNLKKTVDEYKNMTPEEREKNTMSLEDFLKEMNEEEEDEGHRTDQNED